MNLCLIIVLTVPVISAFDDKCCFPEQPTTGPYTCSGDPFCAGSSCLNNGGEFSCGAGNPGSQPDIECQNCGCCPCCKEGSVCCKQNSSSVAAAAAAIKTFEVDVLGDPSPSFNKGVCTPKCTNKCNNHGTCISSCDTTKNNKCSCSPGFDASVDCANCTSTNYGPDCKSCPNVVDGQVCSGHGKCDGAGTLSGSGKCTCDSGFDVMLDCEQCLPLHWGKNCSICPGVISPGTSGSVACSGHGTCDGDGSKQQGNGKCTCAYGWKGDTCNELYCPKGCEHGTCETLDNLTPYCECDKGWHGASCSVPKCPTPLAPGEPGCVHGNCSTTKLEHCDCEPGWGDKRCSTPICTQGCVIGKGTCILPDTCKCVQGYSGNDCGTAVCDKECVFGQGDCTSPNHCTCRPNYQGVQCEIKNAACCFGIACGEAPTSCGVCCQYPRGYRVPDTNIVGCAGDRYTCRNCDCKECCHDGGYCSENKTKVLTAFTVDAHPTPAGTGKCCSGHREGAKCDKCVSGYYGSTCKQCPGFVDHSKEGKQSTVCSGHGQCDQGINGNGTCACENGYYSSDCHKCQNTYCPKSCSGHGECNCGVALKAPACDCVNGFGGDTLQGYDDSCSTCTRGYSTESNCTQCSSGWYGGNSDNIGDHTLRCQECACAAQYCDDGNNGTGKCRPPLPPTTPSPSGGNGRVPSEPIVSIVASLCGVFVIGLVVFFVGRSKNKSNKPNENTMNEALLRNSSTPAVNNNSLNTTPDGGRGGGYNGFNVLPPDQKLVNDDANEESLEERLARMANEI